jgi:hypothetical protein
MWTKKLLIFPALLSLTAIISLPVLAQNSSFAPLKLSLGFARQAGVVSGSTSGSHSLSNIAKFDQNKNPCLGFSATNPDHVVMLEQGFPKLNFRVNSRGKDTTILIKTPSGQIFCGDDTGLKKDASVSIDGLAAGEYAVWVGSIEPGKRWGYNLTLSEK